MNPLDEWIKLLLAASVALGVWVCLTLAFNRTGNRLANRLLLTLVALMLLPPINVYAQMAFGTVDWCWILTTNLTWLYGPLLLAFLRALENRPLPGYWWLHLAPFVVTLVWRFSGLPVPMQLVGAALIVHLLVYLVLSTGVVVRRRHRLAQRITGTPTRYFYWLSYVVGGLGFLMLTDIFLIARYVWFEPLAVWPWRFLVMVISLYLQGLAFVCIYRPAVLFNDVQRAVGTVVRQIAPAREPVLPASAAAQLQQSLEQLMRDEHLYLDNDLTLPALAARMEVSTHQLSSLLNDHLRQSFYDYINRWRLDAALTLLREQPRRPVVELAFEAGFNNKNTFYRLFKERTGLTPSQFRKSPEAQRITA